MKKIFFLFSVLIIASCSSKIDDKSKRHKEASERLNQSQENSDSLFKEMESKE